MKSLRLLALITVLCLSLNCDLFDDRRVKSDILPVNSSTQSVCGMEESYEEKSFLSVKNKIIFALLPIVVIVCIFVCVLTAQQQTASAEMVLTTCHHLSEEAQVVTDNAEHLSDAGKEPDTISHELKEQMEQFTV